LTTGTATAATYYLDAVNGDDTNPGTSDLPWRTLDKAKSNVSERDIVYLRSGNYGAFTEGDAVRTDWITYKADTGHSPLFTYIALGRWDGPFNKYLRFDGITVTPGDTNKRTIVLNRINHAEFINVKCIGQGYSENDKSAGTWLHHANNVTFDGCTITADNDEPEAGFDNGIYSRYCFNINIRNCEITKVRHGITAWGKNFNISDNHLYNLDSDGVILSAADTVIEDNRIHDLYPPIYFTYDGVCSYNNATKTIAANEGSPFTDRLTGYLRFTRSGQEPSSWHLIQGNTSNTITLKNAAAASDLNDIIRIEVKKGYHCDGIQAYEGVPDPAHSEYVAIENITIRENLVYGSERQGIFFYPAAATNVVIENNLVHSCESTEVQLSHTYNSIFRNNTVIGLVDVRHGSQLDDLSGNIIYMLDIRMEDEQTPDPSKHDYNIVWRFWSHFAPGWSPGEHSVALREHNLFVNLFADYASNDFQLAQNSVAIDVCPAADSPATDLAGNARVDIPGVGNDGAVYADAGCYEYINLDPGNSAPLLDSISNKTISENSLLNFDVNATDADGDTIAYSDTGLPSGAAFVGQTFTWTPNYSQAGTYNVTFIVSDGQAQDSETITITVSNVNRAPVLAAIGNKSVNENSSLSFSVSATDADGDTIAYSVQSLPSGAAFTSQTFTWTPGYNQAGTHQVTFTVDDGTAQDSEIVTITVNNVNRTPVLSSVGNKSAYESDLLSFTVSATDADGDTVQYSAQSLPGGATFTNQTFNWTPADSQVGSHNMTFIATDGQAQDSETITIVVNLDDLEPNVANRSPSAGSIQVPLNNLITLHIADSGKGVDANSVSIKVNNDVVYAGNTADYGSASGRCRRSGTKADYAFVYQANELFDFDQTVNVEVDATDFSDNAAQHSYSFKTEMRSFGHNKKVHGALSARNKGQVLTARDSGGNIWAAWHAGPVGSRDIHVAKLTSGEDSFGSSVQLTSDSNDQCKPAIAVDADDKLYIAWQDERNGHWDIYLSTSLDGTTWSNEILVTDSNDNQINPAIVVDGSLARNAYIVWQDDRVGTGNHDIYIASSSSDFATKVVSQITSDSSDQNEPAIAADSDNTVYVVWTDARNRSLDIYGAASNNGPWTNVAVISKDDKQKDPAIAAEATGSILHLLWIDDTLGDDEIFYAKTTGGLPGFPLTGSSIVDDTTGADQLEPVIAVSGTTGNNLKVFACWQDERNLDSESRDTDLYLVEVTSVSGTNVFVGDDGTNANQWGPAIGIDNSGYPYIVWFDDRNNYGDLFYAGSTFIKSQPLGINNVSIASGAIVGTNYTAINNTDDVSVEIPSQAFLCDLRVTISTVKNPPKYSDNPLGVPYEFSPSGVEFIKPVTVTIPYSASNSGTLPLVYWYNPLTGAVSQEGITDIENIVISSDLNALRFETTHFTQFLLLGGGAAAILGGGGGGGGGCSISAPGDGNIIEFFLPYLALTVVMVIIKIKDRSRSKAPNIAEIE
jgi:hypothetical protein